MNKHNMEFHTEGLTIKIEVESELPDSGIDGSQVYTQVISHLIQEAHLDSWMKNPEEVQPFDFFAQVLAAVARACAYSDYTSEESKPAHKWLSELIKELQEANELQELLPSDSDEDEEDE